MSKLTYLKVIGPRFVYLPRKTIADKKMAINMNPYRNWCSSVSNQVKNAYAEAVASQIEGVELQTPVEVTYQVFKPTKARLDKMNVVSVTSKFLLDAMSEAGVWPDDNDEYVKTETLLPTEIDKDNPRVEITFKTIEAKK